MQTVDFVAESLSGDVLLIEVKHRARIEEGDLRGVRLFQARFNPAHAVVITRDLTRWDADTKTLFVPLRNFLLFF